MAGNQQYFINQFWFNVQMAGAIKNDFRHGIMALSLLETLKIIII